VTYYEHDAVGNRTKVISPRGNATYYFYDALNRQSESRDPLGNSTASGYDEVGNQRKVTSPRGYATYYEYDAVNQQAALVNAEGERTDYGYDANGNRDRVRNGLEYTTYYEYDAVNRLVAVYPAGYGLQPYGTSPYGGGPEVRFGYDAVGNRRVEVDGEGNATYYAYDALNRLAGVTDPLGVTNDYAYDEVSNLRRTVDNKGTAVYFGYDALNRRTRIDYPAEAQDFEYDAVGNLTAMEDGWGRSEFEYDALSRVARRTTPAGDVLYYTYDADSNLVRLQYPRGTASCYYSYDAASRMTGAASPDGHHCEYAHDGSGNFLRKRFGNGAVAYYTYDQAERVSSIRHVKSDGTPIVYFDYARDAAGRITCIGREGDLAIYYEYDSIDRLTGEVWRRRSDSGQIYGFWYDYDLAGNRTRMRREFGEGVEWESAYYEYDAANALTKRQVMPDDVTTYYAYDANGSLTKEYDGTDVTYYDYGPHGLITQITPPPASGNPWRFYYDGKLNRYKMDKGGTIGYFLWDGMNLLEERDSTGAIVAKYTHGETPIKGIGSVVEAKRITATTTYFQYLHTDHRGTVYAISDSAQDMIAAHPIDAFGRKIGPTTGAIPSAPNIPLYQTNWCTLIIADDYHCLSPSRVYSPMNGRFIQRDLISSMSKGIYGIYIHTSLFQDSYAEPHIYVGQYNYILKDILSCADPSGAIIVTSKKLLDGPCGALHASFRFDLENESKEAGYFIQQNLVSLYELDCRHPERSDFKTFLFWEPFYVPAKSKFSTTRMAEGAEDFITMMPGHCTLGYRLIIGTIKYFNIKVTGDLGDASAIPQKMANPALGWIYRANIAPRLPTTLNMPIWWNTPSPNNEIPGGRMAYVMWECCIGNYHSSYVYP
jgi:YD repeat-containing protein